MKFKILLIFLMMILCRQLVLSTSYYENEIKMSVDLLNSDERPNFVTALLCLTQQKKAAFVRHLQDFKCPHAIRFINGLEELSTNDPNDLIIADLLCPSIDEILLKANSTKMFSRHYRWLILGHTADDHTVVPHQFSKIEVPLSSEVFIAQEKAKGYYEINLIYKINGKDLWLSEHYGNWTNSSGLQKSRLMMTSLILRRKNIVRGPVIVTYNVDDKSTGYRSAEFDDKIKTSMHSVTIWGFEHTMALVDFINGTRVNRLSDGWGYFVNGSWNGIVGDMARGRGDIAGTAILMTKQRLEHIEYLTDTIQTSIKFVFREPPLSYQNNLFLLPFHRAVWFSLGGFVLLIMLMIYLFAQWESKKENTKDSRMTMSDVAMMIVGAVTQQGTTVQLKGPGRLVVFTLFLVFLFLFMAYSANIVALLQSSSKQIRTLSDLLNSRLELGVENTAYNVHYFTIATDPVRKAIYETKIAPKGHKPKFMSLEEGVKKLQKHPFAFNMDIGVGYKVIDKFFFEHEKCGLQEIAYVPNSKPWLACKKNSPYAELYKIGMYRLREHGMSDRVNSFVYAKRPRCSVSGGSFDSVSIVDVFPPLLMLLYGTLLACALLALEVLVHKRQMKKKCGDVHIEIGDD